MALVGRLLSVPIKLSTVESRVPRLDNAFEADPQRGSNGAWLTSEGEWVTWFTPYPASLSHPVAWFPAAEGYAGPEIRVVDGLYRVPAASWSIDQPGKFSAEVPHGVGSGPLLVETDDGMVATPSLPIWIPKLSLSTPVEFFDQLAGQNLFVVVDMASIPPGKQMGLPGNRLVMAHLDYVPARGVPLSNLGATPSAPVTWELVQASVATLAPDGDLQVVVTGNPLPAGTDQQVANLTATLAGTASATIRLAVIKPCKFVPCN